MPPAASPPIECEMHHPTLSVADLPAAVAYYTTTLGFRPGFTWGDPPSMAGVELGGVSIHLEQGTPYPKGCSVYFVVGDADELFEFQRANGADIVTQPTDRPWGLRDYTVRDPDGHELAFGHRLPVREPHIEVERVEVGVRLEKRLAALLQELADRKRLDVSGCLEEIVLHSFEQVGDGASASPQPRAHSDTSKR